MPISLKFGLSCSRPVTGFPFNRRHRTFTAWSRRREATSRGPMRLIRLMCQGTTIALLIRKARQNAVPGATGTAYEGKNKGARRKAGDDSQRRYPCCKRIDSCHFPYAILTMQGNG